MKKRILVVAALVAPATAWAAEGVSFAYENFWKHDNGASEIVIRFTNDSDRDLRTISADCALLDAAGRALTVIPVVVSNVPARQSAFGNNFGPRGLPVESADCRIKYVR